MDSNSQPSDHETIALPTVLRKRKQRLKVHFFLTNEIFMRYYHRHNVISTYFRRHAEMTLKRRYVLTGGQ